MCACVSRRAPPQVIYGCSMNDLLAKLEAGNLPPKEVKRATENQLKDFGETDGIPECGADALRIGLLAYTVQGRDINLDIKRVVGYRNFCNKLWNATRFMLGCFGDFAPAAGTLKGLAARPALAWRDRFVLSRLAACVTGANECLRAYEFGKVRSDRPCRRVSIPLLYNLPPSSSSMYVYDETLKYTLQAT